MTHGLLGFASHLASCEKHNWVSPIYTILITLLYINNGPDLVWLFPTKHIYIYIFCTNICIHIYICIYIYMMSSYH